MDNHTKINPPPSDKLTVRWLRDSMPLSWWWWIASVIVIVFSFGFAIGSWQLLSEILGAQISSDQSHPGEVSSIGNRYSKASKATPTDTPKEDLRLNDPRRVRVSILASIEDLVRINRCQADLDRAISVLDLEPYRVQFIPESHPPTKEWLSRQPKEYLDAREQAIRSGLNNFVQKISATISLSDEINRIAKQVFLIWRHEDKVKC